MGITQKQIVVGRRKRGEIEGVFKKLINNKGVRAISVIVERGC